MARSSIFCSAARPAALAAALLLVAAVAVRAQRTCASKQAESWEITIAGPEEKGERLVVEGVVTDSDGKPVAGAVVYAYQTGADGYYYARESYSNDVRLCGLMKTDADGRYRFHSIRPGSYPRSTIAAHIHYVVSGKRVVEENFLLEFEGDRFLTQQSLDEDRARHEGLPESYRGIRPLERRDDGSLYCRRDLRVRTR